ncbi:MAG TPA: extracellular solute-binding protein [Aggregatilineaceae bacterium]|nr:extracellular solute-binding protein [Aggregatilineaceae bacterium]
MRRLILILGFLIPILALAVRPTEAQNEVVTISMPDYMRDLFNEELFDQFEAEHPGVDVEIVYNGNNAMMFGGGLQDIDDYLNSMRSAVEAADVLLLDSNGVGPELTRAGYLLDLAPLVNADTTLNSADFYEAVWQAFQWDGGVWALPVSADVTLLFYDPAALDAAGVPYPETWQSIADVDYAIRALTQLNDDGSVAVSGFQSYGEEIGMLLISLLGQGLYDDSVIPSIPNFDNPQLEEVLNTWAQLQKDGLFEQPNGGEGISIGPGQGGPLVMGQSWMGQQMTAEGDSQLKAALLPGGHSGLTVSGYGVSSGTTHPELAYELVKYLTMQPAAAQAFVNPIPARRSLANASAEDGGTMFRGPELSPEIRAVVDQGLENAISPSEARFVPYLANVLQQMTEDNVDARTALDAVEAEALTRLETASERSGGDPIVVATPVPASALAPGEIELDFGVGTTMSPMPNEAAWNAAAQDFADSDPEVGRVNLEPTFGGSLEEMTEQYDCFYTPSNQVPSANLSLLRSLDPLLASDMAFSPNDLVGNVLSQLQRDGQTWAIPLVIEPVVMRVDPDLFAQAGVTIPNGTWNVDEFESALRALKYNPDDPAPFAPQGFDNSYLLALIAAYGGLPVDYRTTPPTLNYTDPNTVEAIRQVLNLVKDGYVEYQNLSGGTVIMMGEENSVPIYTYTLGEFGFGSVMIATASIGSDGEEVAMPPKNTDPMVTFPQGTTYTALTYSVGAGYISAHTEKAEACYRFLSSLSQRPDLLTGMPAKRSMINSPDLIAAQGEEVVAVYNALDQLMQQPNTVLFPTGLGGDTPADIFLTYWLNRAFDRYINEDADLDVELAEAQTMTQAFQQCAAAIPPLDPTTGDYAGYYEQYINCATQVDPSASEMFGQ